MLGRIGEFAFRKRAQSPVSPHRTLFEAANRTDVLGDPVRAVDWRATEGLAFERFVRLVREP